MRLTPLESLLNRNLATSPAARALCQRLQGKVLALHIEGAPLSIYCRVQGEHLALATDHAGTADAVLSGTPLALLRLAGGAPELALRGGAVHIQGDAEVAQVFSELLKHTRPDFEEELSRLIGDVAAHQVGRTARAARDFARRAARTLAQNVAEYLQEEGRDLPSRTETEEFLLGVDTLREDVDRLEARLALLETRRAQ